MGGYIRRRHRTRGAHLMPAPFVTNGKQVLHTVDGLLAPYADAVSVLAADNIAAALTAWCAPARTLITNERVEIETDDNSPWMLVNMNAKPQMVRGITHHIERQGDEYACSCGTRWDVTDGEEHP